MTVTNPLLSIMNANLASVQLSHDLLEIQRALIANEKDTDKEDPTYDLLRPIQAKLSEISRELVALTRARLAVASPSEIKGATDVHYHPIVK